MSEEAKWKPLSHEEWVLARALAAGDHDAAARQIKEIAHEEASSQVGCLAAMLTVLGGLVYLANKYL